MTLPLPIGLVARDPNLRVETSPRCGPEAFPVDRGRTQISIAQAFASGLGKDWTLERIERDCRMVEAGRGPTV